MRPAVLEVLEVGLLVNSEQCWYEQASPTLKLCTLHQSAAGKTHPGMRQQMRHSTEFIGEMRDRSAKSTGMS